MAGAGVRDTLLDGPWVHRDLAANGIRVHLVVGETFAATRPLVLLLHGFGEFWWAWRHQVPALDRAGYSVAAMDLRGYGATDKTPRGYDPHTTAYDVSGVIRSLGFAEATVVGHDWGGMAAWATAAYAPEVVQAMITVAAPHPLAFPWRANLARLAFFQLPLLPERRIMADDGQFIEDLLRSQAADQAGVLTTDEARHYRDALMLWPSPHCAMEYQRMFVRDQFRGGGRDYRRALRPGVSAPVLTISGALDPVVPPAAAAAAGRWVHGPHEVHPLPGVGHLPHEEEPERLTAVMLDWLGRTVGADD
jgi:pimeloyl-ACP methyl ester carboxylesterase